MVSVRPSELLKKAGLKITKNREEVLSVLQKTHRPLNHQEIMELLPEDKSWDRVTIYRALADLEEKHLLKTLMSGERVTYFELTDSHPQKGSHGHLICKSCGSIECVHNGLDEIKKNKMNGFQIESLEVVFRGLCKNCQTS